jgi:hypothetical protein
MHDIREALDDDADTVRLVAEFGRDTQPAFEVALPSAGQLPAALLALAVPHEDIDPLAALLPRMSGPGERWLLALCVARLEAAMGSTGGMVPLPRLRDTYDPLSRYFYVFVYLAARSLVERFHLEHGVDPQVTALSLTDLGRNMAVHRWRHAHSGGFEDHDWLSIHFVGGIYALGRLQFQRAQLGTRATAAIRAAGHSAELREPVLGLHIPRFSGPLTVDLVDAALDEARGFFRTHFPAEHYRYAVCKSWLLDPQLVGYLPAGSNIRAFQDRLTHAYTDAEPDDAGTLQFVFADSTRPRSELPRSSRLQRAIVDHLDDGGHWYNALGWLELADPLPAEGPSS